MITGKSIQNIGVLTSGGDSPGMNAAIRAVVRSCSFYNLRPFGIYEGYQGMIENNIHELNARSVKNILQRGGTILKSSRSEEFKTKLGREKAFENLRKNNINALVLIGGDGTFTGANIFSEEHDIPVIGVPGTIDNDLHGTDFTIGFDSATNVVVECIDKIRDTAESHNRLFFVEVMGRDSGAIALHTAVASGALDVVLPEETAPMEDLLNELKKGESNQKTNKIVIVAEGNLIGDSFSIAEKVRQHFPHIESKVTILGHLQRGGAPSSNDRILASRLGVGAVEALIKGESEKMVGMTKGELTFIDLKEAINGKTKLNKELLRISKVLSV